jgi:hypothetical protein
VRSESILTQLLFDHSLRLRMKDSLGEDEVKEVPAEGAKTPLIRIEPAEGAGAEGALEHLDTNDTEGFLGTADSTALGSGKDGDKGTAAKAAVPGQGLAGKINVLMAADVEAIVEGALKVNSADQAAISHWSSSTLPSSSYSVWPSCTKFSAGVPWSGCSSWQSPCLFREF